MWCTKCYSVHVLPARRALGYTTCPPCGETDARARKHTIVPMHKSNYLVVTNKEDLIGVNQKGGIVK